MEEMKRLFDSVKTLILLAKKRQEEDKYFYLDHLLFGIRYKIQFVLAYDYVVLVCERGSNYNEFELHLDNEEDSLQKLKQIVDYMELTPEKIIDKINHILIEQI